MSPPGASGEAPKTHEKISSCTTRATSRPASPSCSTASTAALADFLIALADFDRERRWLELGHTSLFYFLHRELGLSKGAAFYRKTAAELVQRYPEVVEPLRQGKLCITSVVELAKVITPENRGEVVPRFFHASKREAKAVAAELRPAEAAPHRDVVTVARTRRRRRDGCAPRLELRDQPRDPDAGWFVRMNRAREVPATAAVPAAACAAPGRQARRGRAAHRRPAPVPHHRLASASSRSSRRLATRSRTATPGPTPRRCSRPPSTSSSRRTTRRRGS